MENKFQQFEDIINEIMYVYKHDRRPWLIGYSGGKDSTLLVSVVFEAVRRLKKEERTKKIYVVTSDTMVENPIVGRYMHKSSEAINKSSKEEGLNIESCIIYPDAEKSFWSLVIGLGYPTPEPPGFRWCTERLKILPMNKFVYDRIKENGEVVLLLGVRKDESLARNRSISSREIMGKLLVPHSDIENAYVYNPLTKVKNELVWEYLLRDDAKSPWGTDMKYLFNLYQGENLSEEQSVIGEIDKNKIPVTGNSRFGCWCCTIVKEDKSLQNFINKGATELIPLRNFRNWLVSIRQNPEYRDNKRRNGSVYEKSNGDLGLGPFKLSARRIILEKLLKLEVETGFNLISIEELKTIDKMWDYEGDLSRRMLVDTYYKVKKVKLPWDDYKTPLYDEKTIKQIKNASEKNNIPFELIAKLLLSIDKYKFYTRGNKVQKDFDKILNQGWLHIENIKEGLKNED